MVRIAVFRLGPFCLHEPKPAIRQRFAKADCGRKKARKPSFTCLNMLLCKDSLDFHIKAKVLGDGENILIAPATHVHHNDMVFG